MKRTIKVGIIQQTCTNDIRMKFRYLDLRRNCVRKNLELRHKMTMEVRRYLDSKGFLEVETPMSVSYTHLDVYKRQILNCLLTYSFVLILQIIPTLSSRQALIWLAE